jgi:hypothetical protein
MSRKAINADYMTSRQLAENNGERAALYSSKLGRRVYAVDILAFPQERASKTIAYHLSIDYAPEFMDLCRKVVQPESVTQRIDRTRRFSPAWRSMQEVMGRTEHRQALERVLDQFNELHPDQYYEVLEKLYGIKPEALGQSNQSAH